MTDLLVSEVYLMTHLVDTTGDTTLLIESETTMTELVADCEPSVIETLEQGVPGPRGEPGISDGVTMNLTAGQALSGHRIVRFNALGKVVTADCGDAAQVASAIGMTLHAAEDNATVAVIRTGEVIEPGWAWNPGQPIFLAHDGLLTHATPTAPDAAFAQIIGYAINATTAYIDLKPAILLT